MFRSTKPMVALAALACTAATLVGVASPVHARSGTVTVTGEIVPTALVPYGHLNLLSDAGQRSLVHSVRSAVKSLCGSSQALHVDEQIETSTCEAKSLASAQAQVAAAIRRARTGDSSAALEASILLARS